MQCYSESEPNLQAKVELGMRMCGRSTRSNIQSALRYHHVYIDKLARSSTWVHR